MKLAIAILICVVCFTTATDAQSPTRLTPSPALTEFLIRFDRVAAQGYIKTQRSGSTGIGYTLESLLQIRENNSPRGDLLGMEIKAYRERESDSDHRKMNLFLKEPNWLDDLKSADRIRKFGYIDPEGREAWYQSVTFRTNEAGLKLVVKPKTQHVELQRHHIPIARWDYSTLESRLHEKLSEAVFVAAATQGTGSEEQFHFRKVTYCAKPSLKRLLDILKEGDVILELRMHIKPTGGARNHGTAFRIRKHRLKDLYQVQQVVRPTPESR